MPRHTFATAMPKCRMAPNDTASQPPVALDKFPDLALPALYRAAIGPYRTDDYLGRFIQFETSGRTDLSWNWAAGALTLNWMLFRKMGLAAAIYLASVIMLPLLVLGLGRLVWHWQPMTETMAMLLVATAFFIVPGLLGNGWYYRRCRAAIERSIQTSPTLEAACQALDAQASTRKRLQRLALFNAIALGLVAAAALGFVDFSAPQELADDVAPAPIGKASHAVTAGPPSSAQSPMALPASTPATPASTPASTAAPQIVPIRPSEGASAVRVPAATGNVSAVAAPSEPAAAPIAGGDSAVDGVPPPRKKPPTVATQTASTAPASAPAVARTGHYINVGLFADPDNARRAYVKLVKAGLPASREVIFVRQQKVTRVRSGPYASHKQAQAAIVRIKALALDAVVAKR